jgi:dipeptidyl aminopeptidase/acylaminoacyl peptidase
LLDESSNAIYSSGFLLFSRENTLLARRFDARAMKFSGPEEALAQSLTAEILSDRACFSASETGLLAYHTGVNEAQLTWFDRTGKRVGTVGDPGLIDGVELAPNGKQAAVTISDSSGRGTLWLYEIDRSVKRRFLSIDRYSFSLLWSKDSRRLVIGERTDGKYWVRMKDVGGSGSENVIHQSDGELQVGSWGPDNGLLLTTRNEKTGWNIDHLPMRKGNERATLVSLLHQPGDEMLGALSPNGRWLLYNYSEPGDIDLYPHVTAISDTGQTRQISRDATGVLRWNPNGNEILYASHNKLVAVDVHNVGDTLQLGASRVLFQFRGDCNNMYVGSCFDVSPDGSRFLIAESIGSPQPVALIQNWRAALRK